MGTTHRINLKPAAAHRTESYGVLFESVYVYDTSKSRYPTRIVVWDNTRRPNERNGEPVRFSQYGRIDGGNGKYLDPSNCATDAPVTVLISPESMVITSNGTNTGTVASGQVYSPDGARLRPGDTLVLMYPDGRSETWIARFTGNGHGEGDPA